MRLIKRQKAKILLVLGVLTTLVLVTIYLSKKHEDYLLITNQTFLKEQCTIHQNELLGIITSFEEEIISQITQKEYSNRILEVFAFKKNEEIFLNDNLQFKAVSENDKNYVFIGFGDLESNNILAFDEIPYMKKTHSIDKLSFIDFLLLMGDYYIPLVKADIKEIQKTSSQRTYMMEN